MIRAIVLMTLVPTVLHRHSSYHDDPFDAHIATKLRGRTRTENAMKVAVVGLAVLARATIARGRLIRNGARWSGGGLTAESIDRVRTRLALRCLAYDELRQGSVLLVCHSPMTPSTWCSATACCIMCLTSTMSPEGRHRPCEAERQSSASRSHSNH